MNNNTVNLNRQNNVTEAKKAAKFITVFVLVIILAIIIISSATFTVNEHEQAVVKRFGAITKIIVDDENLFIEEHPETLNIEGSKLSKAEIIHGKGLFWRRNNFV